VVPATVAEVVEVSVGGGADVDVDEVLVPPPTLGSVTPLGTVVGNEIVRLPPPPLPPQDVAATMMIAAAATAAGRRIPTRRTR
jgi:hypothetical protein